MSDEFITMSELADYLRLKADTKAGQSVRFKKTEIDSWLKAQRTVDSQSTQQQNDEAAIADLLSICGIGHSGCGDLAQNHDRYLYAHKS